MNWTTYWTLKKANLPEKASIMTINHHISQYTEWLQDKNLSANTIRLYLNVLDKFPQDFNTQNLQQYFRTSLTKYEATSLKVQQYALNSYIKFKKLQVEWERIVRIIPKTQRKFFDTIDEEELTRLKDAKVEKNPKIHQRNSLFWTSFFTQELG